MAVRQIVVTSRTFEKPGLLCHASWSFFLIQSRNEDYLAGRSQLTFLNPLIVLEFLFLSLVSKCLKPYHFVESTLFRSRGKWIVIILVVQLVHMFRHQFSFSVFYFHILMHVRGSFLETPDFSHNERAFILYAKILVSFAFMAPFISFFFFSFFFCLLGPRAFDIACIAWQILKKQGLVL